jgi:hypothetical protein
VYRPIVTNFLTACISTQCCSLNHRNVHALRSIVSRHQAWGYVHSVVIASKKNSPHQRMVITLLPVTRLQSLLLGYYYLLILFRSAIGVWRKILRHVKKSLASINKNISQGKIYPFARFFCLLPKDCWQDCQRALVDESGVFLCRHNSTILLHAHISPGDKQ